jgi:hypothetical protein
MRKICIILCLSLFTNLIHAAVMEVDLPDYTLLEQMSNSDNSAHHCVKEMSKSSDSTPKHFCHSGSFKCCLGLVVLPSLNIQLSTHLTETLASTYSPLVLMTLVNLIYRPPKA